MKSSNKDLLSYHNINELTIQNDLKKTKYNECPSYYKRIGCFGPKRYNLIIQINETLRARKALERSKNILECSKKIKQNKQIR